MTKITPAVSAPATKPVPAVAVVAKPVATTKPEVKAEVVKPAGTVVTVPTVTSPAPVPAIEPKKIDMDKQSVKDAIAKGKAMIKEGKSKADAAMVIFEALKAEEKEVVIAAFMQGATLTPKGSVTYWYNCRRKAKKAAKQV